MLASFKSQVTPGFLSRLDPSTLDKIATLGATFVANLRKPTTSFRSLQTPPPLNAEQERAIDIATTHPERGGGAFIHGGPGTGKSTVIHALRVKLGAELIVTATTGKASFLVGGETIHSVLFLYVDKPLSDEQIMQMKDRFKNVRYVIVDESSMLGTDLVDKMLLRLKEIASEEDKDKPWAGFRMVFLGDFAQCPPVRSGRPFHVHALFNELEVCLLTQSHRITDIVTMQIVQKMRDRNILEEDADIVRSKCSASLNPNRALSFAFDWNVLHLVTTNAEVIEGNMVYLQRFATATDAKIATLPARRGESAKVAIGCRVTLLQNVNTSWGACNGMFGNVVGVLFGDNANSSIQPGEEPMCVLVKPDDSDIDSKWNIEVRKILSTENVGMKHSDSFVQITETEIDAICNELDRVMPIGYVDIPASEGRSYASSIPLRLARVVTVHKVQGMTLDKVMFTPGSSRMKGTSLTAFTRCRNGLDGMILSGNDDNEHLVEHFNNVPSPDFDLLDINRRLARNSEATNQRMLQDNLFVPVSTDIMQTANLSVVLGAPRSRRRHVAPSQPSTRGRFEPEAHDVALRQRGRGRGNRGANRGAGQGSSRVSRRGRRGQGL
jgi:hypothetical protein